MVKRTLQQRKTKNQQVSKKGGRKKQHLKQQPTFVEQQPEKTCISLPEVFQGKKQRSNNPVSRKRGGRKKHQK